MLGEIPLVKNQYSVNPNGKLTSANAEYRRLRIEIKMPKSIIASPKTNPQSIKPIICVAENELSDLEENKRAWAIANNFSGKTGSVLLVPGEDNKSVGAVLLGIGDRSDPLCAGALVKKLPEGIWQFAAAEKFDLRMASIGFLLGSYSFDTYKKATLTKPKLLLDPSLDSRDILRQATATWAVRDLINIPASDMGPDKIEAAARAIAKAGKASIKVTKGADLLSKNFPMIHAVGRASTIAPRLIDFSWGNKKAPKITLVGKGVAFDTGGLDIKPASSMRNMKKDMGGAANVLGLAQMIMDAKLNVRLRVLIPAVENSIAGNAFRPGDILQSRKGLSVEIGHTDAEGRLVLADALALAAEEKPDLIIDMATLTGAARVALGPDLPPYYTNDETFSVELNECAKAEHDPLWRMPLWQPYHKALSSKVADMNNVTTDGFAGSITAALFLQRFVPEDINWAHFDVFGWTPSAKHHAPIGGEAQGIRALLATLSNRYN
ncbi:putative cytosol aminopeptidase [Nymphon striatum]|nr:putative cytosol aminopeptidase [Nymphon striatum]